MRSKLKNVEFQTFGPLNMIEHVATIKYFQEKYLPIYQSFPGIFFNINEYIYYYDGRVS